MQITIYDTPLINVLMRGLSLAYLKLFGWTIEGRNPDAKKFVVIAAPHTSNWDFPIMLSAAFALRLKAFWLGKHSLFRGPFGPFFTWLGGIPIDRRASHDVVSQSVELFNNNDEFVLAISPEGSRSKTAYWKTGFYYIALGAGVPILTGFIDYRRKTTGLGPALIPTGDIESDMEILRSFYSGVSGKYPENAGSIAVAPR